MSTPVVQFIADDPYGLWKAGERAWDLGRESDHPDAPPIRLLRTHRDYELISLTEPIGRYVQPAVLEYGILWESNRGDYWHRAMDPWFIPGGIAIFESREAREKAITVLIVLGYRYWTTYRDTHGFGLSWAQRSGSQIRQSARERLPSYQNARHASFGPSLYRNPGYDLIHDPDPRYFG